MTMKIVFFHNCGVHMKAIGWVCIVLLAVLLAGCAGTPPVTKYVAHGKEIPPGYFLLGERFQKYHLYGFGPDWDSTYLQIYLDDPLTPYKPDMEIIYRADTRRFVTVLDVEPGECKKWGTLFDSLLMYGTDVDVYISDKVPDPQAALYFRKIGSSLLYDIAVFYDQKTFELTAICCKSVQDEPVCFYPVSASPDTI